MLHSVKGLEGFALAGTEHDVGTVRGTYFDDERWVIRHLVGADVRRLRP